jgi:hypothetical protein
MKGNVRSEKRAVVERLLREEPATSDRAVARTVGVSHPWVAKIRSELEALGDAGTGSATGGLKRLGQLAPVRPDGRGSGEVPVDAGIDFLMFLSTAEAQGWPRLDRGCEHCVGSGVASWLTFTASADANALRGVWAALMRRSEAT